MITDKKTCLVIDASRSDTDAQILDERLCHLFPLLVHLGIFKSPVGLAEREPEGQVTFFRILGLIQVDEGHVFEDGNAHVADVLLNGGHGQGKRSNDRHVAAGRREHGQRLEHDAGRPVQIP